MSLPHHPPRRDLSRGDRDYDRRARSRERDEREKAARDYRNRRSRSPLGRSSTFPARERDVPGSTRNSGNSTQSPALARRNSAIVSPSDPSNWPPVTNGSKPGDGTNSAFTKFLHNFADANHWWSQRYQNGKKAQKLSKQLDRFANGSTDYVSQQDLLKNQVKEAKAQEKAAADRFTLANKNCLPTLIDLLSQEDIRKLLSASNPSTSNVEGSAGSRPAASPVGQDQQAAFENRLAALEKSYKASEASQGQRISLLEAKINICSKSEEDRRKQITELEKKLAKANEQLESANEEIKQLKSEVLECKTASHKPPQLADAPEITDLQANVLSIKRELKDFQVDSRRFDTQYNNVETWKTKMQNTQRTFATKEELKASAADHNHEQLRLRDPRQELLDKLGERVHDVEHSLKEIRKAIATPPADLTPRLLALERSTATKAEFDDLNPGELKAIVKRDFSMDIALEVSKQLAAMPAVQRSAANSPGPSRQSAAGSPASGAANGDAIAAKVTKDLQESLNVISQRVAEMINKERTSREELSRGLTSAVADIASLSARLVEMGNKSFVRYDDLAGTRASLEDLIRSIGTNFDTKYQALPQQVEQLKGLVNTSSEDHTRLTQEIISLNNSTREQYVQLLFQQNQIASWQNNFTTKGFYDKIVTSMSQLVPEGTMSRLRGMEVRMEHVERSMQMNAARGP